MGYIISKIMLLLLQDSNDNFYLFLYNISINNLFRRLFMENSKKPTFLDCLSRISDPRKPHNQLHEFLDIVAIAVLATLCGADTWNEIESWGIAFKDWLSSFLTLKNGIPSHDTFNRVFQMIAPEEFHDVFLEWIQGVVSMKKISVG